MEVLDKKFVSVNNLMIKLRQKKCPPGSLLLLFPHCIQYSKCKQNINLDLAECKRCGKCKVKDLMELSEEYGVSIAIANGGRVALQRVMAKEIKGIIAIACEKELRIGIMAAFSKRVLGVANLRPHGYCIDTDVALDDVRKAIEQFLEKPVSDS